MTSAIGSVNIIVNEFQFLMQGGVISFIINHITLFKIKTDKSIVL